MKFQSEKKELWRYASKNLTAPARGTSSLQPLPHRLPHQHLLQSREFAMMSQFPQQPSLSGYCAAYGENSTSSTTIVNMSRQENVSTPPPPYSSVPELECSPNATMSNCCQTFCQHQTYPIDGEMETSVSAADSDTGYSQKQASSRGGYNYVNTGDIMFVDDYDKLNETSTSSCYHLSVELQKKAPRMSPQPKTSSNPQLVVTSSTSTTTSSTTAFAAAAARILRNCCGATFGSSNSVTVSPSGTNSNNNNHVTINTRSTANQDQSQSGADHLANDGSNYLPEQYFSALMKQLKANQISSLLKAIKSRHDQVISIMPTTSSTSSQRCCGPKYQANCILIRRAEILGEEPYVIACRLFFWRELKNASQLKRLPVCPNERDPVYICCNPLHWCRILETEIPPPPYQSQKMNFNEGVNLQTGVNPTSTGSTGPDNIRRKYSDIRARATESLTTDGEGRRCSPNWCEIAYWEMAQRVGERFPADTPVINIFADKPYTSTGDLKDGMCLKELIGKCTRPSPDDVQHIRQKIGSGIILSQESDGVWLFNRSTLPIFVYSPTLTESWYRVCRVEPGDCLKAFDKYRAQALVDAGQFPDIQPGPIDNFSMRISFGKGWGCSYKRPDITLCPCWLEVLFKPRR